MRRRLKASGPVRSLFAVTIALAALAAPVASGTGIQPTGIISAGSGPVAAGKAATITVYLVRGERLVPVVRPGLPGHPFLGVTQLGVPVTSQERRKGLRTEVPRQREIQVRQDGPPGEITVDLIAGETWADFGGWSRAALGQLACTAQAVPGVRHIVLAGLLNSERDFWVTVTCDEFDDLIG